MTFRTYFLACAFFALILNLHICAALELVKQFFLPSDQATIHVVVGYKKDFDVVVDTDARGTFKACDLFDAIKKQTGTPIEKQEILTFEQRDRLIASVKTLEGYTLTPRYPIAQARMVYLFSNAAKNDA